MSLQSVKTFGWKTTKKHVPRDFSAAAAAAIALESCSISKTRNLFDLYKQSMFAVNGRCRKKFQRGKSNLTDCV